ncbi:SpoIIE family protein phosphatase [Vampirovibrio sp.]|uniref:SpoIIE family protein phosphatase n=1 Tax=Vampirovibrio sp. TaxID=2717857 RepID=UPI0035933E7A
MFKIFSVESVDNSHPGLSELRRRLVEQGYEMLCPQKHRELMDDIKEQQPDLILLDPTIPDQTGFKVCQGLKDDPETENIPVIFIHSQRQPNAQLLQSLENGATDLVSIETEEIEVMARLKAAIRNKRAVSQSVQLAQQLNKINTELYERNLQVEKELYVARQLQQSLLPPFLPDSALSEDEISTFSKCHYKDDKLRISGLYLPCDSLGGDIYDVIKFPNNTVGVAIADVSGHGVPAGFITAIFKSSFYRITHNHTCPADILFHLNNELADIIKTGEYVTAIYSRICPRSEGSDQLSFEFSGAGHPYPLHYKAAEDKLYRPKENGTPLVWIKDMAYPLGRIDIEPGDKIFLFTDGVSEMRNIREEMYSEEKLEEVFLALVRKQSPRLLDEIIQILSDFTEGHPLEDDLSAVLIEAL